MTQNSSSHFLCHKAHTYIAQIALWVQFLIFLCHQNFDDFWNKKCNILKSQIVADWFWIFDLLHSWSWQQIMNLLLNTTFFEHIPTLTKTQDFFLSFLVFRIGGPLCMLLPTWCLKVRTDVLITDESMDGLVCSKKCWNDALYALCEKICIWQNSAMGHNRWQMNSCESWGRFMKK